MFDRIQDAIGGAYRALSGKGTISEANIRQAADDVRTALLEADANYQVVEAFCEEIVAEALGREVTRSLKPGQEFVGVVHRKLVELLSPPDGAEPGVVQVAPPPTVVMMCGLQGSGKTTTCAKLAAYLKKRGRSCLLVAADLQRPAAVDQLRTVAEQVERDAPGGARVLFYAEPDQVGAYGEAVGVAVGVCQRALKEALRERVDTVILDTAGRLHVNDELMGELERVHRAVRPHQTFLVVDAMTGQDAVHSAKAFHERLHVDGVVLTKFDSDTRGGAALSINRVTGAPIRFIGVGEKLDALEEFHAERIAGRILGMGDVVTLVEKAQEEVSEEEAAALQEKLARGEMTFDDFLKQLRAIRRMGPLKQVLGMLPGVGSALKDAQVDDKQLNRIEGIINSMTSAERRDPSLLTASRRRRIARGSASSQQEVNRLVKQFEAVSKMAKQMAGLGAIGKIKAVRQMQGQAQQLAAGGGFRPKAGTRTVSPKAGYKKRKAKRR
ncbi:MAG: signal recognition particle protein [Planctomycetota bacterium]|nr:MAG: signal recognition particle protein [Planctomycetota bacterium]